MSSFDTRSTASDSWETFDFILSRNMAFITSNKYQMSYIFCRFYSDRWWLDPIQFKIAIEQTKAK